MSASILVADDEPGIREMLHWALTSQGFQVATVSDGLEAVGEIRRAEFDLVLSDIRMPRLDGIGVLRAAREIAPDTEVIIATAHGELQYAVECVRAGAFDFIQKPFDMTDLLARVSRALERRRLRATTALYEASRSLLAIHDPQRLPEVIVEVAMKVMVADDVSLMLPDAENRLYIAYSHGLSPEVQADVRVALGQGIAGRIALLREAVLLTNGVANDPRLPCVPSSSRVHSAIVYPLLTEARLLGMLNISRVVNDRPFRKEDLERASILASQIVLALENARLLRQIVIQERLASVGELAAGVAHEMNGPVSYVLSNHAFLAGKKASLREIVYALESDGGDASSARNVCRLGALLDECQQALDDLGEGAARIRDISRDLTSLARNDEGSRELLDLNEPIRAALRITGAQLRCHAKVEVSLDSGLAVKGSAGRLSQVFINLLVNAAQAFGDRAAADNRVTVTSGRVGNRVMARVSDNGPGIRPEHLGRIFETFFTTKPQTIGTGLGLSISRDIVRSHGGEIVAESAPGLGASFTILLPFAGDIPAGSGESGVPSR